MNMDDILRLIHGEREPEDLHPFLEACKVTIDGRVALRNRFCCHYTYDSRNNSWYNACYLGKKSASEIAKAEKRWLDFVMEHSPDFYPHALEEIEMTAPFSEWIDAFRSAWYLSDNIMINESRWRPLLKKAGLSLMTQDEMHRLGMMKDVIDIYRGCSEHNHHGLSWTISPVWAHNFPEDRRGVIVQGDARRSDVIAYIRINGEEDEIIIFPESVNNRLVLSRWMH